MTTRRGTIVSGTSRLLRGHWRTFLVLNAILDVPLYLLGSVAAGRFASQLGQVIGPGGLSGADPIDAAEVKTLLPTIALVLGVALLGSLASTLGGAAIALAVRDAAAGRPPRVLASYAAMLRRSPALMGAFMLSTGAVAAIVLAGGVLLGILSAASGGRPLQVGGGVVTIAALVVIVGMVAAVIALQVRLTVASQAVALEDRGPLDGLRRSWRLTAGAAWRVFGVVLLFAVITVVLGNVVAELGTVVGSGLGGAGSSAALVLGIVVGATGSALVGIIMPVGLTVLFADLRMRRDGVAAETAAPPVATEPGPHED